MAQECHCAPRDQGGGTGLCLALPLTLVHSVALWGPPAPPPMEMLTCHEAVEELLHSLGLALLTGRVM